MGIGGGVLPYLHMIFPVLPAHLLRDFVKQWALSGMEGQCHSARRYPSSSALISQSPVLSGFMSCLINSARWQRGRFFIILYPRSFIGMRRPFRLSTFYEKHRGDKNRLQHVLSSFELVVKQVHRGHGSKYPRMKGCVFNFRIGSDTTDFSLIKKRKEK